MNQERTIMGACDYMLATLQNIKSALMDYGSPQKQVNWAIGGMYITLGSNLMKICDKTFLEAARSGETSARNDLQKIKNEFNTFIDRMINND